MSDNQETQFDAEAEAKAKAEADAKAAEQQALLDAQAAKEAAEAADEAARAEGFANAEAKAAAAAADERKAKPRKALPKPKGIRVKIADDGLALLRGVMDDGPVTLRFGDSDRAIADLPDVSVRLRVKGSKLVTDSAVVMPTSQLSKVVDVTHCYACDGQTVLAACEMGSTMAVAPNMQIVFKPGAIAFF